jgi:hypothetical protein
VEWRLRGDRALSLRRKSVAGLMGMAVAAVSVADRRVIRSGAWRRVGGPADNNLAGYKLQSRLIAHTATGRELKTRDVTRVGRQQQALRKISAELVPARSFDSIHRT